MTVSDPELAIRYGLSGSPTFWVDGADLFPPAGTTGSLTCRIYNTPSGLPGDVGPPSRTETGRRPSPQGSVARQPWNSLLICVGLAKSSASFFCFLASSGPDVRAPVALLPFGSTGGAPFRSR